jgi:hypothetical protein
LKKKPKTKDGCFSNSVSARSRECITTLLSAKAPSAIFMEPYRLHDGGWCIFAYARKSVTEEPILKHVVTAWFYSSDFDCSENNSHEMVITHLPSGSEIKVCFHPSIDQSIIDRNYQIVFMSSPFWYKDERAHFGLCEETMQKIRGKKQAFRKIGDTLSQIRRLKRIRPKRARATGNQYSHSCTLQQKT